MVGFFLLLSLLPLLGLTVAGQEAIELVHLHEPSQLSLQSLPHTTSKPSIGVAVSEVHLPVVSSSVLAAEGWLKTHVLAHFPSTNITTIVVGKGVLCNRGQEHLWGLVLPSVKNLYYSLVRWGMVKEIKVSAAFSSDCLQYPSSYSRFRGDIAQNTLQPLASFLQETSSGYTIDHSSKRTNLVFSAYREALERLGRSRVRDIRVVRKLSSLSSLLSVEGAKTLGLQVPSHLAKAPRFPSVPLAPPPPDASFSFPPDASPPMVTANPPDAFPVPPPPCLVAPTASAPGPVEEQKGGLWCVAKPTVPAEKLQEAMDYACGDGGADCGEIRPNGSCYYPDNAVAHASYAFNSYWQKMKQSGGSCNFDGTAVLINSDPSFLQCHFELS
ncbi:glucan endo-1,3-beta-glucosidase 13-like isoform X1 [Phoenix dactylifera]|uniref:Glucan endo-1,3-beta-glucosidase 13-like isoform X1 n=1 Tax=Phoenix dactylifera TaxID=42345 RepID=A0A8B9A9W9_PHODC|nr:glucan endo-1,3-beta-glucosidase 13-like isoform X1 [Phoenix dactylifera]